MSDKTTHIPLKLDKNQAICAENSIEMRFSSPSLPFPAAKTIAKQILPPPIWFVKHFLTYINKETFLGIISVTASQQLVIALQHAVIRDQHLYKPCLSDTERSVPAVSVSQLLKLHSGQAKNRMFFADREISNQPTLPFYRSYAISYS